MKSPYTYSMLRYVHDITAGEAVNVGVALLSPDRRFTKAKCRRSFGRLTRLFPDVDVEFLKRLMQSIEEGFDMAADKLTAEPLLHQVPETVHEVARQVLPFDDSSLQWSPLGSGCTVDPESTLESLYSRLVAKYDEAINKAVKRSDRDIWKVYRDALGTRDLDRHLKPFHARVDYDEIEFKHAYKNGIWHCLEPVSFDLLSPEHIRDKARKQIGRLLSVKGSQDKFKVYFLLGEPEQTELKRSVDQAVEILRQSPVQHDVFRENEKERLSEQLEAVIPSDSGHSSPMHSG
jgi:hypothetical protein